MRHGSWVNVLFADGSVGSLLKPADAKAVSALLDIHADHSAAFKQLTRR